AIEMADYFYEVSIECGGADFDVRVNDSPVWRTIDGMSISVEIVANRWLRPGGNELSVQVHPPDEQPLIGQDARAVVKGFERHRGTPRESRRELGRITFAAGVLGTFRLMEDGGAVSELLFQAQVSFQEWAWMRAPVIPAGSASFESLLREIDALHELLR